VTPLSLQLLIYTAQLTIPSPNCNLLHNIPKHQPMLLLWMRTNICVWCCSFLKTMNLGLTFVGTKNSDQQMRENDNWRNDLCGYYFHSLNRILSRTIEIERRIWENKLSGNDRLRFHCIYTHTHVHLLLTLEW
jgi:hypothetical protein